MPHERREQMLQDAVYDRCREQQLEPPSPLRIERIIRSALRAADEQFYQETMERLSSTTRIRLDALLKTTHSGPNTSEETGGRSTLHDLKQGAGAIKVDSLLDEVGKLEKIEELELPKDSSW